MQLNILRVLLMLMPSLAMAASEEIQVYMDEVSKTGEFGLDIHSNYVFSGNVLPDYPGAQAPAHVFRLTPEFFYGLTDNLELGLYLLSSLDSRNSLNIDGEKLRLKYIAPKEQDQAYFLGANFEIGYLSYRLDQNSWSAQLKGIMGYRSGRWTFAVNPNASWSVTGAAPVSLELDTKVACRIYDDFSLGLESYNGMGSVDGLVHANQQNQNLYLVVDTSIYNTGLNFGIGRGFSPVSDKWLIKAIVSVPFGAQ